MAKKTIMVGDKELNRRLKALATNLGKKIVRKAARPAMKPIHAAAKANAPRRTGLLQKSIKIRAQARSRKWFGVRVTIGKGDYKGKTFYGAFQEYGWKTGKKGSENRKEIEDKHFMKQAFDSHKEQARTIFYAGLRAGLDAEVNALNTGKTNG